MVEAEEQLSSYGTARQNIMQHPSVIKYRLDTNDIKQEFEVALSGKIIEQFVNSEGKVYDKETIMSKPRCNKEGYQAIVSMFSTIVNPQGLQANLKDKLEYNDFISKLWEDVSTIIMENRDVWEITEYNYRFIMDTFMNSAKLMLTHPIRAGTRQSMTQSSTIQEYATVPDKRKGLFGMFKK